LDFASVNLFCARCTFSRSASVQRLLVEISKV
jgi:hypothetical protein